MSLKTPPLKTTYVMPNRQRSFNFPGSLHEWCRITSTKTGQQWVLDISGGQYGIYRPLWKWKDYRRTFVVSL